MAPWTKQTGAATCLCHIVMSPVSLKQAGYHFPRYLRNRVSTVPC